MTFYNNKCINTVNILFTTIFMEKNKIIEILNSFWLTKSQSEIFIFLYSIWKAPASVVANAIWWERTNTYKSLKKLVFKWILSEITIKWIKNFFIADKKIFIHKFEEEEKLLTERIKKIPILQSELSKLDQLWQDTIPDMRFFQWKEELNYFYEDIYNNIIENDFKIIKLFASNTLENKSQYSTFEKYSWDFIDKLKIKNISIETYLWNWIMMFENIVKTYDIDNIKNLPAWNSSLHTYIFWDYLYVAIYKNIPFAFKIKSYELTQMLHFLFKNINYRN